MGGKGREAERKREGGKEQRERDRKGQPAVVPSMIDPPPPPHTHHTPASIVVLCSFDSWGERWTSTCTSCARYVRAQYCTSSQILDFTLHVDVIEIAIDTSTEKPRTLNDDCSTIYCTLNQVEIREFTICISKIRKSKLKCVVESIFN